MKKVKILGKSVPILVLVLLGVGMVSATLVTYFASITTDVEVKAPITLVGDQFSFDVEYSGEDSFALIELTNHADVPIPGNIKITVSPDVAGIRMALSEDINYCLAGAGDMTGIIHNCKIDYMEWLEDNTDWFDWEASHAYSDILYPSDLVINHDGDSFKDVGYIGNSLIFPAVEFPADTTLYAIMYISTNTALTPTTYTFNVSIVPV